MTSRLPQRLTDALNQHDLELLMSCFHPDYVSEQPNHPGRSFRGNTQARKNWTAVFAGVPDFRADLLRSTLAGDTWWAEWHWRGTRTDGTHLEMRGVTLFGLQGDQLAWGRLYLEDVSDQTDGIDENVRQMVQATE